MKIVHSVDFSQLVSLESLFAAWDEYKKGKINKFDVMEFERHLEDNIFELHRELSAQTYRHGLYTTFRIFDPKSRIISKAAVKDRVVHHLVFGKLYQIFNPTFIYHSYSSRLNRGTHLAVANLAQALRKESGNYRKPAFVLKCDVKKFFQSVNHRILLQLIQNKSKDSRFLWLVGEIVESFSNPVDMIFVGGGG